MREDPDRVEQEEKHRSVSVQQEMQVLFTQFFILWAFAFTLKSRYGIID